MAQLDFGRTDDEALIVLKGFADRVNNDLYNHGKDGLLTRFNAFVIEQSAREDERDQALNERHRSNAWKLNLAVGFIGLGTLIVAIIAIVVSVYVTHHAGVDPSQIFHSSTPEQVIASEAKIPIL